MILSKIKIWNKAPCWNWMSNFWWRQWYPQPWCFVPFFSETVFWMFFWCVRINYFMKRSGCTKKRISWIRKAFDLLNQCPWSSKLSKSQDSAIHRTNLFSQYNTSSKKKSQKYYTQHKIQNIEMSASYQLPDS